MPQKSLEDRLKDLPVTPGVYFHKNSRGEIIYVGKAAVLKNRVRQYFQKSRNRDPKTETLVREIADIDWIEVESEIDALFLESELIKRYKPRFNIELRDDKSNLFVRIDIKSDHPTVTLVRRPLDDGAEYFGPFLSGFLVRRALKYLRRIFPFDTKRPVGKRVTLEYHLGLSPGLHAGKTSLQAYRANLRRLMMYLKGQRSQLIRQLEKAMGQAAKNQQFEAAASLRNQIASLKELKKQIVFGDREFMDISKDQGLGGLQELLDLPSVLRRIEGYDISHMQGVDTTASMVVFTNGIPDKAEYRKFKLRIPGNDDFAHMREVLTRRFSGRHLEWPKPDLVLIDGGKGQLSSALAVLDQMKLAIPAIGLAKRQERVIVPRLDEVGGQWVFEEVVLAKQSHVLKLLQRIRDESHRFAVSYHTVLRTNRQRSSQLDGIPTIGPATRKKLIKAFGSMRGVTQARQWELERTIGAKRTAILRQYLRSRAR